MNTITTITTINTSKAINQSTSLQKGFSLIEISMVIAVIAILLIASNFAFNSVRGNINRNQAIEALDSHFITAVQQCQNRFGNGNLTGCTNAVILAVTPLTNTITPWGRNWVAAVAPVPPAIGTSLTVTYPLAGATANAANDATFAANLAAKLSAISAEVTVVVPVLTPTTIVVTYTP